MQSAPSKPNNPLLNRFVIQALAICSSILIFVYIAFLVFKGKDAYHQAQFDAFLLINSLSDLWPLFWLNITQLGDAAILIPLLSFLVIYLPKAWITLFVAAPLAGIVSYIGKKTLSMPRPAAVIDQSSFNIVGDTLTGHNSLPSGHTITVFVATTIVVGAFLAKKNGLSKNIAMLCISGGICRAAGISRITVGAHWPLDVLTGAKIGIWLGILSLLITTKYPRLWGWLSNPKHSYIFGAILLLWSLVLFKDIYTSSDTLLAISLASPLAGLLTSVCLFKQYYNFRVTMTPHIH